MLRERRLRARNSSPAASLPIVMLSAVSLSVGVLLAGASLGAQPIGRIAPQGGGATNQDSLGVPARLFESPNLDRFLRRANDFLEREDFDGAIKVLQDVLEGRTLVAAESETDSGEAQPGSSKAGSSKAGSSKSAGAVDPRDDNPSLAVFSADDRLYRPVRRLCHELLAIVLHGRV